MVFFFYAIFFSHTLLPLLAILVSYLFLADLSCTPSREMVTVEETTFLESVNSRLQLVMKNRKGPVKWLSRSRCLLVEYMVKRENQLPKVVLWPHTHSGMHMPLPPTHTHTHTITKVKSTCGYMCWYKATLKMSRQDRVSCTSPSRTPCWGNLKWRTVPPWSKASTW